MENRLDLWLVENMGIKSRSKAQELIRGGYVLCNGAAVTKTGYKVSAKNEIKLLENEVLKYVSRGGLKLEKAIREFNLDFKDKKVLDIGSSTGGFTDCALKAGAKKVIAVDVGSDIMDDTLRADSRIELYENTDIREFPYEKYSDIDFAVCDASFISLPTALKNLGAPGQSFTLIALIKPQFECGIKMAKKYKCVVNDKGLHKEIIARVIEDMDYLGFHMKKITWSPISGGDGNIEYIAEFYKGNLNDDCTEKVHLGEKEIIELTDNAFEYFKK
ncbi:MAG: TlyA family RNA methyltransferase [Lachnospiraceae bacterium]|nr:TlyA family RNA methyltransferase [Lachnospiraceae bacterium]